MKSPFPGMDPYVESHWGDVHSRLVLYSCDQLQPQLPAPLVARVQERLVVVPVEEDERSIYPDVRVVEHVRKRQGGVALEPEVAVTEPVVVEYGEPATETFIHILDPKTKDRLVTVIEFLSRSNKFPGNGQDQYRQKQAELRAGRVSLVEIDLLRSGKRVLSLPVSRIPRKVRTTYQVCVRRGFRPNTFEVYPVPLRRRLPVLRIPLRPKDDDIHLDLQAVLDQAYRNGAYGATIDYRQPPDPPLAGDEAKWADRLLGKARK